MNVQLHPPAQKSAFSTWMDLFRWACAAVVLVSHTGGPMLVALSEQPPAQRHALQYPYSFIAGFSHHAVIIFFILSGYFVGGALLKTRGITADVALDYFSKRLTRLWIVLIPALFLSFVLYTVGHQLNPDVYLSRKDNHIDFPTAMCNALFMQNALCGRYASNDSLWSLFNEFWYYVAFFLGVAATRHVRPSMKWGLMLLSVGTLIALQALQQGNAPLIPYFLIWLAGVVVAVAPRRWGHVKTSIPATLTVLILVGARLVLGPDRMHGTSMASFMVDACLAGAFAWLLMCMKGNSHLKPPPGERWHPRLASFSYSLYCTHLPLVLFFTAAASRITGRGHEMIPASAGDWLLVLSCLMFACVGAFVFYLITEKHTDAVRSALTHKARALLRFAR